MKRYQLPCRHDSATVKVALSESALYLALSDGRVGQPECAVEVDRLHELVT